MTAIMNSSRLTSDARYISIGGKRAHEDIVYVVEEGVLQTTNGEKKGIKFKLKTNFFLSGHNYMRVGQTRHLCSLEHA